MEGTEVSSEALDVSAWLECTFPYSGVSPNPGACQRAGALRLVHPVLHWACQHLLTAVALRPEILELPGGAGVRSAPKEFPFVFCPYFHQRCLTRAPNERQESVLTSFGGLFATFHRHLRLPA